MKKNFFAAALILSLGVGSFAACSSDDVPVNPTEQKKTTTMMSIALKMPAASGTRTATDEPNNYIGEWLGQDKIENVKVYVFNAGNVLEASPKFTAAASDFSASQVGTDFVIRPNKGIEVAQGAKTVYVVVNSNALTEAFLPETPGTTLANFEAKYKSADLNFAGSGVTITTSTPTQKEGVAAEVAELKKPTANPSDWKNVIVMTGAAVGTMDDNVSETTAISGAKNQVSVTVKRLVARAAVTSSADFFDLTEDDPYNPGHNVVTGTVSGFTYVAAQGERKVNFLQTAGGDDTSNDGAGHTYKWNSPAVAFISDATYGAIATPGSNAAQAREKYDYASLWKGDAATNGLLGTKVVTKSALALAANNTNAAAIGQLMEGDFLLPTTHKWGSTATDSEYKKGNTAYLMIRTIFQPKKINMDNDPTGAGTGRPSSPQAAKDFTYNAITATNPAAAPTVGGALPDKLVRGANGMFYSTVWASQDPMYNGVNGQAIEIFDKVQLGGVTVGYKMIYFAWVNPDNVTSGTWLNSPVYRNNIYHVQLDGVGGTGLSWNPLIPGDNTTPNTTTPNKPATGSTGRRKATAPTQHPTATTTPLTNAGPPTLATSCNGPPT